MPFFLNCLVFAKFNKNVTDFPFASHPLLNPGLFSLFCSTLCFPEAESYKLLSLGSLCPWTSSWVESAHQFGGGGYAALSKGSWEWCSHPRLHPSLFHKRELPPHVSSPSVPCQELIPSFSAHSSIKNPFVNKSSNFRLNVCLVYCCNLATQGIYISLIIGKLHLRSTKDFIPPYLPHTPP